MQDRTEEDALGRVLLLRLGGREAAVRTLTIEESDAWLGRVAEEVAALEVPDRPDPDGTFAGAATGFLTRPSSVALRLLAAYDLDGALGGEEGIRATGATKRELRAALEATVGAEDPFGEAAARSVAAAFGEPSRSLWAMVLGMAIAGSVRATSTDGPSSGSDSGGRRSGGRGAGSSSSSDGPTPIGTRRTRRRTA